MKTVIRYSPSLANFGEYLGRYLGGELIGERLDFGHAERGIVIGSSLYEESEANGFIEFASMVDSCLVMFTGTDIHHTASQLKGRLGPRLRKVFEMTVHCVDGGPTNVKEVETMLGRPCSIIRIPCRKMYSLRPFRQDTLFHIGCRTSPTIPERYHLPLILDTARILPPEYRFHVHHPYGFEAKYVPRNPPKNVIFHEKPIPDMDEFLTMISCALRFMTHDTFSMVVQDAMMAGRYAIGNSNEQPFVMTTLARPDALAVAIDSARRRSILCPEGDVVASKYYHEKHSPEQFIAAVDELLKG